MNYQLNYYFNLLFYKFNDLKNLINLKIKEF